MGMSEVLRTSGRPASRQERHHHVEQHDIRLEGLDEGQGRFPVIGFLHAIPVFFEIKAQKLADIFIVVRNQDFYFFHGISLREKKCFYYILYHHFCSLIVNKLLI
jgi:hypothetical protein